MSDSDNTNRRSFDSSQENTDYFNETCVGSHRAICCPVFLHPSPAGAESHIELIAGSMRTLAWPV